jgi:Fuc2NAc and GlcNAc transferase
MGANKEISMFFLMTLFILSALISYLISLLIIKTPIAKGLIDIPNERSSHEKPTPRGGGVGIVVALAFSMSFAFFVRRAPSSPQYFFVLSGFVLTAALGFWSDRSEIAPYKRLFLQALISAIVIFGAGYIENFNLSGIIISGPILTVIWLTSITNFYNFMDGIDGLAGMQGVIAGIGIAIMGIITGDNQLLGIGAVVTGALSGFLVLNMAPARIFMGDTGSYALGFLFAAIPIIDQKLFLPIALILGVFIFDTVFTLIKRLINREECFRPHRNHFYQRAVKLGLSHLKVTLIISAVSSFFVLLAIYAFNQSPAKQFAAVVCEMIILSALAFLISAVEKKRKKLSAGR